MKKRYAALFAAAFAVSMIAGCGTSNSADQGATAKAQSSAEQSKGSGLRGEAAPTFTLKNLAGEDVAVEAKGKPYIINLWATWCTPCQAEIPVQKFMQERKAELPVVLDAKGSAATLYGVRAIPTTVVVDQEGKVAYRKTGGVTKEELEDVIGKL